MLAQYFSSLFIFDGFSFALKFNEMGIQKNKKEFSIKYGFFKTQVSEIGYHVGSVFFKPFHF